MSADSRVALSEPARIGQARGIWLGRSAQCTFTGYPSGDSYGNRDMTSAVGVNALTMVRWGPAFAHAPSPSSAPNEQYRCSEWRFEARAKERLKSDRRAGTVRRRRHTQSPRQLTTGRIFPYACGRAVLDRPSPSRDAHAILVPRTTEADPEKQYLSVDLSLEGMQSRRGMPSERPEQRLR